MLEYYYLIPLFGLFYFVYYKFCREFHYYRPLEAALQSKRKPIQKTPPPYPNGWFKLLDTPELGVGETKYVELLGQNFVVFRGEDKKTYVTDAFCPHLGANLAIGGEVEGSCIVCPFHGWKYDGKTGLCVNRKRCDNHQEEEIKIRKWTSMEINDMILVWHHINKDGTFEHTPSWYPKEIEEIMSKKWDYRGLTTHIVKGHIQDIPENIADSRHFLYVHKQTYGMIPIYHHWKPSWRSSYDSEIASFFEDEDKGTQEFKQRTRKFLENPITSFLYFSYFSTVRFFGWKIRLPFNLNVMGVQVGPGLVYLFFRTEFGSGIFLQSLTPIEKDLQMLVHKVYSDFKMPYWLTSYMIYNEGEQVSNDVSVWTNKIHIPDPVVASDSDNVILSWRQWYRQFYTFVNQKTLDW